MDRCPVSTRRARLVVERACVCVRWLYSSLFKRKISQVLETWTKWREFRSSGELELPYSAPREEINKFSRTRVKFDGKLGRTNALSKRINWHGATTVGICSRVWETDHSNCLKSCRRYSLDAIALMNFVSNAVELAPESRRSSVSISAATNTRRLCVRNLIAAKAWK